MCIVVLGGADWTSTSYVYSSLVVHAPGRVAARAPVHPSVLHLGLGHVELADHVALVGLVVTQVVVAVLDDRVIVQRPAAPRRRRALHLTEQEDWLVGVEDFLAEGGQDFWSSVCGEKPEEHGVTRSSTEKNAGILTLRQQKVRGSELGF